MAMTETIAASGAASDMDIVQRVLNGDGMSFELIMRRYNRRLYRIARGFLKNDADAEDTVQDAYLHAYRNLARFEGKGPLSAWLAKIASNVALGRLRSSGAGTEGISFDDPEAQEEANFMADVIANFPTPEQNAARGEVRRLLETAIDALPDAYRMVFMLFAVEGLSVNETAECLDVEAATVKTRYHRARKILQEQLASLVDATAGELFPFDGARCDRIVAGVLGRLGLPPGDSA
ncbi:RNA polymerase sigma factor [Geomesophilobacter sediminis]|uniref:RNA polymerase sigma factor n=1 Tax=Geomesophilobacter sediminis TaxID=2798584 RepID=A0A8J7IQ69_9BACT|nr:RNA polymerase sigma factor [Geomesophilobacter sediminis]MBJ6724714.1 RNA polymerase sigma factor [Geomesophilobacter sediminis]